MVTPEQQESLRKIKVTITDVDGVMTDGGIILGTDGQEFKRYDVKDGLGVTMARKAGLKACIITGRKSESVTIRGEELKFDGVYQGYFNKVEAYQVMKKEFGFEDENYLHLGDDILDLPLFGIVGFSVSPADGIEQVRTEVDYVTTTPGGRGALRETVELVLEAQGKLDNIIKELTTFD